MQTCEISLLDFLRTRAPIKPWCCDEFYQNSPRPLETALSKKYIQLNPPGFMSFLQIDIDRAGASSAWEDADLPPPTWVALNPKNSHAHLVWVLAEPVWAGGDNQKPAKYFTAIREAFRLKLGGDPGFSGLLTKNPLHPDWWLYCPAGLPQYDLQYLSEFVDLTKPPRSPSKGASEADIGRNCMIFEELRYWAYSAASRFSDPINFGAAVADRGEEMNSALQNPMQPNEVAQICRSIAKWTWRHMGGGRKGEYSAALLERQRALGKKGGEAKGRRNEEKREQAIKMASEGMSCREIAKHLEISKSSISTWIK